MVGIEPHNIEYIADEKTVYATMLITRYGKLIWSIALELFVILPRHLPIKLFALAGVMNTGTPSTAQ